MSEQKHLGLTLESLRAKKHIGIILSRFLPLKTLDQMYKTLVRPHLDYCDVIYHIPSKQDQLGGVLNSLMYMRLTKVQYQAAISVQLARVKSLYEELGWESLSIVAGVGELLQVHKIVNNKAPAYSPCLHRVNNNNTFHEIRCKSSRYMNQFLP